MPKKQPNNKDLERVAKLLGFVYETSYLSYKRMIGLSFIRGFMQGMGGFVGATLGAGLLLWVASSLLDVPLLGNIIESIKSVSN